MTYIANHRSSASHVGHDRRNGDIKASRPDILRRAFDALYCALHESRRRQAEREIANFSALRGSTAMSDDLEREMSRHFRKP
jgi:hypothetical protein